MCKSLTKYIDNFINPKKPKKMAIRKLKKTACGDTLVKNRLEGGYKLVKRKRKPKATTGKKRGRPAKAK